MKHSFFCLLSVVVLLSGCVQELPVPDRRVGSPIEVAISFGARSALDVEVATKSTLGLESENRVFNLFFFIFDENGNKIYNKYFDAQNLLKQTLPDWWEVTNNASGNPAPVTSGKLHLRTQNLTGCTIAAVANIDAEMVNISPEQLGTVNTKEELLLLSARMNQDIVSRSGYFPMSDMVENVDIAKLAPGYSGNDAPSLALKRLDAKIYFNVMAEPGSKVRSFTPNKWKVVNVPNRAYVMMQNTDATQPSVSDFFDTESINFETRTLYKDGSGNTVNHYNSDDPIVIHGFSFYMLENRKANTAVTDFTMRDLVDHDNPVDQNNKRAFKYAPAYSTYVIVTGTLDMDVEQQSGTQDLILSGEVQYIIHLGNFSYSNTSSSDFAVCRNTTYTYNVYIRSAEDIRTEVEANYDAQGHVTHIIREDEPGATGRVVVAKEAVYVCDAHYNTQVISFHADNIDEQNVTWHVQTPFNPDGAQPYVLPDGTELVSEIDCKWVEFMVNDLEEVDGRMIYGEKRKLYNPRKTMGITELVKFLREQKALYNQEKNLPHSQWTNLFDEEVAVVNNVTVPTPKISVTAFVNEYYYETNPITKEYDPDLWKRFVNQPMRQLHILSNTRVSADGESSEIGSSYTVQQKSIQTIYNVNNPNLHSAWGMEHTDDDYEAGYDPSSTWEEAHKHMKYVGNDIPSETTKDRGNTSTTNGRLNCAKEWNLVDKNGQNSIIGTDTPKARWDNYLNLEAKNATPTLRNDNVGGNHHYRYLRWSCMSRNRDNNGNGLIDRDEIRWYMAASNQLVGIFLGGYGIDYDSQLYQRTLVEQMSDDRNTWRQHVIASTRNTGNNSDARARVVWAEEGMTGSDIGYYSVKDGSTDWYNTRCVRNLGHDPNSPEASKDFTFAPLEDEPEALIQVKRFRSDGTEYPAGGSNSYNSGVYYEFDCTNINEASLRYYTDRELVSHDETHEASCLYKKFTVASQMVSVQYPIPSGKVDGKEVQYINQLNEYLDDHIGKNPFCPEGYRLPNAREDAVIWSFIPTADRDQFLSGIMNHSRTHWSFGVAGVNNKNLSNKSWGWTISSSKIIMGNHNNQKTGSLRCVKDIKVN